MDNNFYEAYQCAVLPYWLRLQLGDAAGSLWIQAVSRKLSPWSGVIDSQSINPSHTKAHNYNAGKEIVGRQRHIVVDMDDLLILVVRDISDIALRTYDPRRWLWVKHLLADGAACDIFRLMDKVAFLDCTVGIIRRSDATKGRSFSRLFNSERK